MHPAAWKWHQSGCRRIMQPEKHPVNEFQQIKKGLNAGRQRWKTFLVGQKNQAETRIYSVFEKILQQSD